MQKHFSIVSWLEFILLPIHHLCSQFFYLNIRNHMVSPFNFESQCVSSNSTDQVHHLEIFNIMRQLDYRIYVYKKHEENELKYFSFFWTEKHQFWMDVNVCFLRITGHMKRLTWGWVIMVISSPWTSTNTSPAFRPALWAGVSIPRTFSTWATKLISNISRDMISTHLHNCGNVGTPHNP